MITVKGYKEVEFIYFQSTLYNAYKRSGKTYFQVAGDIEVNSTQTPANALTAKSEQIVSDDILSRVMNSVGLDGFIVWALGKRTYFLKK